MRNYIPYLVAVLALSFSACSSEGNDTPTITSPATATVNENQTDAITITATDADNDTLTYSLSGTDAASFNIDSATGVVTFKVAPDYETKSSYSFSATANDLTTSDTQVVTITVTNIGDFYIKSAVYDNNATASATDDRLYVYFSQGVDENSIAADRSSNYTLDGTGKIGSASLSDYNDTFFHQHTISLNDLGDTSTALIPNDTNISIATDVLQDIVGAYTIYDANVTTVEKFRTLLKTGEINTYGVAEADGTFQTGTARSYTRDDTNSIVTDNVTGLIWQDDITTPLDMNFTDAISYCEDYISLDANADWRLPTKEALGSLTDYTRVYPSINPIFQNTVNGIYWTSTTNASSLAHAWASSFNIGSQAYGLQTSKYYVRCVRTRE